MFSGLNCILILVLVYFYHCFNGKVLFHTFNPVTLLIYSGGYNIVQQGFTSFSKNLGATSKFCAPEG